MSDIECEVRNAFYRLRGVRKAEYSGAQSALSTSECLVRIVIVVCVLCIVPYIVPYSAALVRSQRTMFNLRSV